MATLPNPLGAPGAPQPQNAGEPPANPIPAQNTGNPPGAFSQQDVDRIAGQAREAGRLAAERAAQQALQAEQGQFKPLYETEKARADGLQTQLDTLKGSSDKLRTAFHALIDAQLDELPEAQRAQWKALKPDTDDPEKLQTFVVNAKALAGVAQIATAPPVAPLPNSPQPANTAQQQSADAKQQKIQANIDNQRKRSGGAF